MRSEACIHIGSNLENLSKLDELLRVQRDINSGDLTSEIHLLNCKLRLVVEFNQVDEEMTYGLWTGWQENIEFLMKNRTTVLSNLIQKLSKCCNFIALEIANTPVLIASPQQQWSIQIAKYLDFKVALNQSQILDSQVLMELNMIKENV